MQSLLKACYGLATKLGKHRQEIVITCEPDCWCWDAEALLTAVEDEMQHNISARTCTEEKRYIPPFSLY